MLQIRLLSGEAVASIPVEETCDVRGLKRRLHRLHGFPPRYRQRLLADGKDVGDSVTLHSPMDLDLVLLNFPEDSDIWGDNLTATASAGSPIEVESLLQLPQDPDLRDREGDTALMSASYHGHIEVVRLLLEAGADVDMADARDFTALHLASRCNHVEIVRLLLEAGADTDLADGEGCTALRLAALQGHVEVARLLLESGAEDVANKSGDTALMIASGTGDVEMVHLLLAAGFTMDLRNEDGRTALTYASWGRHMDVVRLLLMARRERDLPASDDDVCGALRMASSQGYAEVARLLLESGAEKDVANDQGFTALITASASGRVEVVRLLLEAGANPNLADEDGCTALMIASARHDVEVVSLLLDAGADKDLADNRGRTALMRVFYLAEGKAHVSPPLLCTFKDSSQNYIFDLDIVPRLPGNPDYYRQAIRTAITTATAHSAEKKVRLKSDGRLVQSVLAMLEKAFEVFASDDGLQQTYEQLRNYAQLSKRCFFRLEPMSGRVLPAPFEEVPAPDVATSSDSKVSLMYLLACHKFFPSSISYRSA
eukprot:s269_g7.t1